jgi:hypothetical protein
MTSLGSRKVSLIAIMSAVSIVVAYSKGLALASLPGVIEFMTVLIFITGYCFGTLVGGSVGVVALTIYMLIPSPFAHPAAWLFSTSPILLVVMALLGGMFGVGGAYTAKFTKPGREKRFTLTLAVVGLILTFVYDIMSSVGFALAYPAFTTIWQSIIYTFIPLFLPYPPIIHTVTNAIIFALVAPVVITAIKALPSMGEAERTEEPAFSTLRGSNRVETSPFTLKREHVRVLPCHDVSFFQAPCVSASHPQLPAIFLVGVPEPEETFVSADLADLINDSAVVA